MNLPFKQTVVKYTSGHILRLLDGFTEMNKPDASPCPKGTLDFRHRGWPTNCSHSDWLPRQARDPHSDRSTIRALSGGETEARLLEDFASIPYPVLATSNLFLGANRKVPTYVFHLNALQHSPEEGELILFVWLSCLLSGPLG